MSNWQTTVDLLADIAGIPAALIMRVHPRDLEVFISSHSEGNVYKSGELAPLDTGLYCETVMDTQRELLVPNALSDPLWDQNPDIKLGMIAYCGFPLTWPTGDIFGTICILDLKENRFSDKVYELMSRFRDSIQLGLENIYEGYQQRIKREEAEDAFQRVQIVRQQVMRDLKEKELELEAIIENLPTMVFVKDAKDLRFVRFNRAGEKLLGKSRSELIGRNDYDFFPKAQADFFTSKDREVLASSVPENIEKEPIETPHGTRLLHTRKVCVRDNKGKPKYLLGISDDITERVHMQNKIMQTEKMMSVVGLAAGMARELNNPLGGILQGLQNVRRRLSLDLDNNRSAAAEVGTELEKILAYMEKRGITGFLQGVTESGELAANIVNNMLKFAHKSDETKHLESINAIVEQTLALVKVDYDLKEEFDFNNITIIRGYDESDPEVSCIASEIQQVLLNIFRNAAQAFANSESSAESPAISVRTYIRGDMAAIEVEDNGPGIKDEIGDRVFEPFYTTRKVGAGTGLGLSISYFIVKDEHGGNLSVVSKPGQGAKFILELPLQN